MGCGFCESSLSNSLGTWIVDCVVKPVGRQLDYVRRFHDNVEKLMERKGELTRARDRLQHEIEDAERQLQQIEDLVQDMLSKAENFLSDMETLEEEIQQNKRCLNWCPNWSWRYRLSKNAIKKTLDILELLEKITKFGQPGRVGYRATSTLPNIEFLCSKEFVVSNSANTAFNQIIEALQDDNISMIGLWGMGGVGKTTLVREVGNQAQKSNLFNKVVITSVSQKPNFEAIQDEIAQYLGFDMKNERGRRSEQELWLRLKNEKRILIILDDVWADINLKEKIGIPLGEDHKGCKILLTTRRQQVCFKMDCQKVVPLGCLDDHEAWTLFAKKAGLNDCSEDDIKKLANQVIKKCQGLPIAIVTLGSALKGKSRHGWEAAYRRLKNRRLTEIEDVNEENAYLCLEASFDYLKDMETKICFLLCSLFPEDCEIYVEDLVRYAWGLELYKGVDSIEEVRGEVLAAMDILKNSCLLLDCGEKHVKMHDTVREFALWIASSKKEISFVINSEAVETWPKDENLEHYTAISFKTSQTVEPPKGLVFPSLKILLLGGKYDHMTTSNEFFEGMKALKVCALDRMLMSLAAFQFQTNLRTLHLKNSKISDISILGKLKTLQVLSFNLSDMIELPNGIGELENLRLLELSNCRNLQRIPPHSILRLSNLEELYLDGCSSIKWATEDTTQQESYSSLSELNSLPKLAVLSLDISFEQLPKGFVFCKLQRFDVCIGIERQRKYRRRDFETCPISRSLKLETSVDACKQLFEDVESLDLKKLVGYRNLVPSLELDQRGFGKLTSLDLQSCKYMKCLIDTSKQQTSTTAFSNLVNLSLRDMLGLGELCNGSQPYGFLQKLKTLWIDNCKEMTCAIPVLQNLEELKVESCDEMQVLFQIAGLRSIQPGLSHLVSLQSLKVVEIDSCNKLRYLFPMSVANSLGQLETLKIKSCLGLEEIIQAIEVSDINLQSLRKVHVEQCDNLTSLSSLSHGQGLENLIKLVIRDCDRLEYTFPVSMSKGLPQLNEICLVNLPQLKGREGNDIVLTLPSLQELEVNNCPQLTSFIILAENQVQQGLNHHVSLQTFVANSLGQLETLTIESCAGLKEIIQATDLSNIGLQSLRKIHVVECNSLQSLKFVEINNCNNLKYLFPTSVANSLGQLETLMINSCSVLEEIIQATDASNIGLQSLREVNVVECNNLTSLSSLSHGQSLDNLIKLVIRDCYRLEYTFSTSMVEGLPQLNEVRLVNLPQFKGRDGNDIVLTLPSLQELKVQNCPQLTPSILLAEIQVQQGVNRHLSFQSLKVVEIYGCNHLRYLFPIFVAHSLGQLEKLKLKSCLGLEEIIQATTVSAISLQNLKVVEIDSCNKLRCHFPMFVAGTLGQLESLKIKRCLRLEEIIQETTASDISLQNLKVVEIDSCNKLRYLFPMSIANSLAQLESLKIKNCFGLEEIIQARTVSDICLQSLNIVEIDSCNKLKYVFPMAVASSLGHLESLKIKSCLGLEEIIQATIMSDVSLQSLREVYVEECNNLTSLSSLAHGHRLKSLSKLEIYNCLQLEYTFSIPMAEGLPQLNVVHWVNVPRLKGRGGNDIVLSLRSLQKLKVHGCPQLIPFIISTELQELEFGGMKERKQMCNTEVPEVRGRSANMEYLTITNFEDLFDSRYNLSSMRKLRLEALPELRMIWKGPVQVVNFQNLTNLVVYDCRRLRYVFSATIASNLPQLSSLRISNCEELEQIIEKDQTSSQYQHLQTICFPNLTQIVINRCENLKCLFPITVAHCGLGKLERLWVQVSNLEQLFEEVDEANVSKDKQKRIQLSQLRTLLLEKLSNLVSFSPVGYHFFFPCLHWLKVKDCPNITTSFSVDSKLSAHVKTEASRSVDEIIEEESATAHETTWPIGGDISWSYYGPRRN